MNFEQQEQSTGWRAAMRCLPASKAMAQKIIMPLGYFYSPFIADARVVHMQPSLCSKCKASVNSMSERNRKEKTWNCLFCGNNNPYLSELGTAQVEEYLQGKSGDTGVFFIVDLCLPESELDAIKESLISTVQMMPKDIFVGLLSFNRNVFIRDFSTSAIKFTCLNGLQDYSANGFAKLRDCLGLLAGHDPRSKHQVLTNKYYVPLRDNGGKLIQTIDSLKVDKNVPADEREKRATGCALQIAIGMLSQVDVSTRFVCLIGGPCTVGLGKVVELPTRMTIRSYVDILQGNENASLVKGAAGYYESLATLLVKKQATLDIWAYGVDQFGLMEMKSMVVSTGGLLAMHEEFNYFIFKQSFPNFYQADPQGRFQFPIACKLTLRVSKDIRINGMLGPGKSLQDNTLKTAADMQIGQGNTNLWYIGGINPNTALCFILSLTDSVTDRKESFGIIQAMTTYKYSDNVVRTKVSTLSLPIIRENQMGDIIKHFDEKSATVMLARLASKKAEIEDHMQVKKWLDRILLKFIVRFATFNRHDKSNFKISTSLRYLTKLIYHLRRSSFINTFGSPPDQSIYIKSCLLREDVTNCITMIQPILIKYTTEAEEGEEVQLELEELKENVILLLDSYFNVLLWSGEHIQKWKEEKLHEKQDYRYLADLFELTRNDASEIMYDRIPCSNFYDTFKNDGKERYLKSRINPNKPKNDESDGHFVSDDAPLNSFQACLHKAVATYND